MNEQHYLVLLITRGFNSESITQKIDSWDVEKALQKYAKAIETYHSMLYGFRFITKKDGKIVKTSGSYYVNGKIETLKELIARNDPKDEILIENLYFNKFDACVRCYNGWTTFLFENDIVIELKIPEFGGRGG